MAFLMQIHPTFLLLVAETFKISVTPPFRNSFNIFYFPQLLNSQQPKKVVIARSETTKQSQAKTTPGHAG